MENEATLATDNSPEYSVSELSTLLKRTVEEHFGFVRVRGELSGVKRHSSGHLYFALKDADAVIDGVAWRGVAGRLSFRPEDGLEVIASGRLTTYPGRSKYQLVVERLEPAGAGALMALLEERKRRLAAEGLFAAERKRPLPFLPTCIGVVTSPTGAVIRDILHRLADRFPRPVLVWPVAVQGEGAADQVARAIRGFNALAPDGDPPRPDLLIVARGGGSLEDLWAFNEEVVARAAAESAIPLISAVGHETDTTLIDFVSDRRAPTPTAAAEMAVPVRSELLTRVAELGSRAWRASDRLAAERQTRLEALGRGLRHPRFILEALEQRFDDLAERLPRGLLALVAERRRLLAERAGGLRPRLLDQELAAKRERLAALAERLGPVAARRIERAAERLATPLKLLEALSYTRVLARGYAVVRSAGQVATQAAAISPGTALEIEFADGRIDAQVLGGPPARRRRRGETPPEQGSLI